MSSLKNIPFFKKFTDDEIEKIQNYSFEANYNVKDIVFYEMDEPEYLYILLEGIVDVYKTNSKGKQLCVYRINAVDFLGELTVFQNILHPTTVECATKCKVLKIDYKKLGKDFCENTFFCKELVKSLYKRIISLMNIVDNSFLTTKERVAKFILNNKQEFYGVTYTEISKKLNMTPETLSRILNDFKRKNLIEMDKEYGIKIKDEIRLKEIGE